MAHLWVCQVSGRNYSECPEALTNTLRRGGQFKAAAWLRGDGQQFKLVVVKEMDANKNAPAVRVEFQKLFNERSGTVGKKLPGASLSIEHCVITNTPLATQLACEHPCNIIRDFVGGWEQADAQLPEVLEVAPGSPVEVTLETPREILDAELQKALALKEHLTRDLAGANKKIREISDIREAQTKVATRAAAEAFAQQFRMSASLWDPMQLDQWFQVERHDPFQVHAHQIIRHDAKYFETKYGPDVRTGNEDLDPFMLYIGWYPDNHFESDAGGSPMTIDVKLGMDTADAQQFGLRRRLPLNCLVSKVHLVKMASMGFTPQSALAALKGLRGKSRLLAMDVSTI